MSVLTDFETLLFPDVFNVFQERWKQLASSFAIFGQFIEDFVSGSSEMLNSLVAESEQIEHDSDKQ